MTTKTLDNACVAFNQNPRSNAEKSAFRTFLRQHRCSHSFCHKAKETGMFCAKHAEYNHGYNHGFAGLDRQKSTRDYMNGFSSGVRDAL